jgi:hypothetical protein
MRITRLKILVIFLGLVVIAVLYPFEVTVVPAWRMRIVDEKGVPLTNSMVREVWMHYSIETRGHEEDSRTDNDGYVSFPERTIRAPLLQRLVRTTLNKLNPHGSLGPVAYIICLAPGYDSWQNDL